MKSVQTPFFATRDDLLGVVRQLESEQPLQYIEMRTWDSDQFSSFDVASSIDGFGVGRTGDQASEPTYLVIPKATPVTVERFSLRDGSVAFTVDQKGNPGSITVRPGGLFRQEAVIAGTVGTVWTVGDSRALYDHLAKRLRKSFKRVKAYYVGPEALEHLRAGLRLTSSVRAPREFDLRE